MPNKHAMLSASSSARWLACPPSAQLCAALPDTVTDYALEGTCAHELAEYKVQRLLGNSTSNPTENLDFYDAEMEDCTDSYAQYIDLQRQQGFDLERYAGKRAKRYTYEILNYPSGETGVQANLLLYKTTVIGGEVLSPRLDGFLHGLAMPETGDAGG